MRYTADIVVTTTDGHVLLIERGWDPHKGAWAL
ncbi:NUDIX hydrolase, partial [Streptomyces sp. McG5]|nr:NUDIX hydrolase [Streptomyces sp. McG5]